MKAEARKIEFTGDARKMLENLAKKNDNKSKKLSYKIAETIRIIQQNKIVSNAILKKITGLKKSWEIRISFDKEAHRFYGIHENEHLVIMRYYLSKKTPKTPKSILNKLKKDEK